MTPKLALILIGVILLGALPANYHVQRHRYSQHARTPEGFAEITGVQLRPGTEIRDYKLYAPFTDGPNSFWLLHDEGGLRYLAPEAEGHPPSWFGKLSDAWPELSEPIRSLEITSELVIGNPKEDNFLYLSEEKSLAIVYAFRP
ncbi:MAG: hypothetical protein KDN19_08525 [Verrucomicrobiae bacterium]|nr:hypothetical protein [Verrucomicrobiae bacterium]